MLIGGDHTIPFPPLLKYPARNTDNHMANWKVIETVSGNIAAISGQGAQQRPGTHERTVWEGRAADKAEALQCAEKADPRVDLEWMRICHDRDLNYRDSSRKYFCGKAVVSVNYGLKSSLFNRFLHNISTAGVCFRLFHAGGSLYNRR